MNHLGTKVLETDRLILRPFKLEDAQPMYDNWANDPEVTKYLTWTPHANVEATKSVLADWITPYERLDYYKWAIVLKAIQEPVGGISAVNQQADIRMVEIGYCIGKNWWRQGYTSEALSALVRFFFEEVGVNRVEAGCDPRNPHSSQVMMKCGLKYEGTLRQAARNNQGFYDCCVYALLAEDYFQRDPAR